MVSPPIHLLCIGAAIISPRQSIVNQQEHCRGQVMLLQELQQSDFNLLQLAPKLTQLRDEVVHGRGFVLLKVCPDQTSPV